MSGIANKIAANTGLSPVNLDAIPHIMRGPDPILTH